MKLDDQYAVIHDDRQWVLQITSQVESKDKDGNPTGKYPVTTKYYGTLQQLSNALVLHQIPHTESIEALKDHIDTRVAYLAECLKTTYKELNK